MVSTGAFAADLATKAPEPAPAPTPFFDLAFGGKIQSDYISRGITQTNHKPGVTAYFEPRFNLTDSIQAYVGTQVWSVKLPTAPAAEVDLYGGIRPTFGNLSLDIGAIYYDYPNNTNRYFTDAATTSFLNPSNADLTAAGGRCGIGAGIFCATTAGNPSYLEIYFKPSYAITDAFTVGGNLYFAPNWNAYHVRETYASVTAKYTFPFAVSVSGELGREWIGALRPGTIFNAGPNSFSFKDYTTWNVGVSYTYKQLTADLRYYGSNLSGSECFINGSDPRGTVPGQVPGLTSNWCSNRVMASLSFDLDAVKDLSWFK